MDKRRDEVCGCGGSGTQRGLGNLIAMLERQQKPVNQAEIETGEFPAIKSVPDTRPKPQGKGGCA